MGAIPVRGSPAEGTVPDRLAESGLVSRSGGALAEGSAPCHLTLGQCLLRDCLHDSAGPTSGFFAALNIISRAPDIR
jgi:hypothetical protein